MDLKLVHAMVQENKAVLLDCREESEVKETGIAEGARWMPMSKVAAGAMEWTALLEKLPKDKKIFLYCASGMRSGKLAEILKMEGFDTENIGGLKNWVAANLPVRKYS